jgi:hypothetical protein
MPAELHVNRMQWFKDSTLYVVICLLCSALVCTVLSGHVATRPSHNKHITYNHCIRFTCNLAGMEELPDDDTHVSKHVGAAE